MLTLLLAACGSPPSPPPPTDLRPPWDVVEAAVGEGTVAKESETSLVVDYPAGTDPTKTASRYLAALEAAGHAIEAPKPAGPATLWNTTRDGRELLVSAVSKKSKLEIHLDW